MIGQRFGRLIVLEQSIDYVQPSGRHRKQWLCKCDCGATVVVIGSMLRAGKTKSCGCLRKQTATQTIMNFNQQKHTQRFDLSGEYGIGYTSKGEPFYFDLEDYDLIKDYTWYFGNHGYLMSQGKMGYVLFHRLICPNCQYIDHIHHDKADNRKSELRVVTCSQNSMNRKIHSNNTSGVTGVNYHKKSGRWTARIMVDYKRIELGEFDLFEDAVRARKEAEEYYFGEYSYDNSLKVGGYN